MIVYLILYRVSRFPTKTLLLLVLFLASGSPFKIFIMTKKLVLLLSFYFLLTVVYSEPDRRPPSFTRIVGGEKVTNRSEVAYQASLRYYNQHICGATIIDKIHVVTAAHCCYNNKKLLSARGITIVAGDLTISKPTKYTIERKVKYVFTHPKYNQDDLSNDIAVLRVAKPFGTWNDMMRPINLSSSLPEGNTGCLVSGWGKLKSTDEDISDDLYKVTVPIMDDLTCKTLYSSSHIKDGMFCAGLLLGQKDSCQGDSGGPLVCNKELVGVVSWGVDCAAIRKPGVYTDVSKYNNWIQEQILRSSSRVTSTSSIIFTAVALIMLRIIQY